jgi:hypothetical protein
VHGLGWARDHEIGGCLTDAVRALGAPQGPAAIGCPEAVRQALLRLEAALGHMAEGLRPQQPASVEDTRAQEVARDE